MMKRRKPPAATIAELPAAPADESALAARAVDKYYDSLLVDGMDPAVARLVEEQRSLAHQAIVQAIFQKVLGG